MPDLNQIKQGEQGVRGTGAISEKGAIGQPPGEAERIAAVVDSFVRAIDASDFDRRLPELDDVSKARAAARIAESGSPWIYNR